MPLLVLPCSLSHPHSARQLEALPAGSSSSACKHIQVFPTLNSLASTPSSPFLRTSEGNSLLSLPPSPPIHSLTSFCQAPAFLRPLSPKRSHLHLFLFPVPSSLYIVVNAVNYILFLETFFSFDLGETAQSWSCHYQHDQFRALCEVRFFSPASESRCPPTSVLRPLVSINTLLPDSLRSVSAVPAGHPPCPPKPCVSKTKPAASLTLSS